VSEPVNSAALDALTRGLFDYAGMFPPASRSFEEALSESARLRRELRRPGLVAGDLVVQSDQVARLDGATLRGAGFPPDRTVQVCVLGSGLSTATPLEQEMTILLSMTGAARADGPGCRCISYEVKIPRGAEARSLIEARLQQVARLAPLLCLEPDLSGGGWEEELDRTASLISGLSPLFSNRIALKLRCGGPTAIDVDRLAAAIVTVADRELHLKATGGLHHPLVDARWGNTLGFLSLAVALALRRHHGRDFGGTEVAACLRSVDPAEFTLGAAAGWRQWRVSASDIEAQRHRFHLSIGSCSLHEPDGDLTRLFGAG